MHIENLIIGGLSYPTYMKHCNLVFLQKACRTFTAEKRAFGKWSEFHRVRCDERTFVITARHGASLLALDEKIEVHVVATSPQSCQVCIISGNQMPLNILNIGSNKRNVTNLSDWISNQVYRLCSNAELFL